MAVPLDVVVISSCTFRYHFAVFVCCGINDIVRTSDKLHASHINGIRPCRQRHIGRCGDSEANLVQLGALGPAHRAVLVDFLLGAEGFADTFRFLGIADFTDIGAGGARRGRGIAADRVVLVLAAQGFRNAAALLTALVGAGVRRLFLTLCREGAVRISLLRVGMDALGHGSVALLRMGMGAGDFRRPFGVAAAFVVLGVVLAQPALLGKDRGGNHGYQQTRSGKDR